MSCNGVSSTYINPFSMLSASPPLCNLGLSNPRPKLDLRNHLEKFLGSLSLPISSLNRAGLGIEGVDCDLSLFLVAPVSRSPDRYGIEEPRDRDLDLLVDGATLDMILPTDENMRGKMRSAATFIEGAQATTTAT